MKQAGAHFDERRRPRLAKKCARPALALRAYTQSFNAGTTIIPVNSLIKTKRWLIHRLFNIAHVVEHIAVLFRGGSKRSGMLSTALHLCPAIRGGHFPLDSPLPIRQLIREMPLKIRSGASKASQTS